MQHQYTTQLAYTAKKCLAFPELTCYVYLMLHLGYPKVYSWSLCSLSGWCATWVASEPCWYSWIWIIRQPCGKLGQGSTEIQFSLCLHHNLWCSSFWEQRKIFEVHPQPWSRYSYLYVDVIIICLASVIMHDMRLEWKDKYIKFWLKYPKGTGSICAVTQCHMKWHFFCDACNNNLVRNVGETWPYT